MQVPREARARRRYNPPVGPPYSAISRCHWKQNLSSRPERGSLSVTTGTVREPRAYRAMSSIAKKRGRLLSAEKVAPSRTEDHSGNRNSIRTGNERCLEPSARQQPHPLQSLCQTHPRKQEEICLTLMKRHTVHSDSEAANVANKPPESQREAKRLVSNLQQRPHGRLHRQREA